MNDDELFRQQFADVKPLKKTDKVALRKTSALSEQQRETARARATDETVNEEPFADVTTVSDDYVEQVGAKDILSFKRPGIQDGVFKKLRLGKYPLEARLDLHRKKVAQARREVFQFVADAMSYDSRCLLIVHGKGDRNPQEQGILKSHVAKWLKEIPDVMAYHSAQIRHGGAGAVYVMLRKSERAKEQTREKIGRPG